MKISVTERTLVTRYWHVLSVVAQFVINELPVSNSRNAEALSLMHFIFHKPNYNFLDRRKVHRVWDVRTTAATCNERNLYNLKMIDDDLWRLWSAYGNRFVLIKIFRYFRLNLSAWDAANFLWCDEIWMRNSSYLTDKNIVHNSFRHFPSDRKNDDANSIQMH